MTDATTAVSAEDIGDNLRRIMISGRLDSTGIDEVAAELLALADVPKNVVVDLTGVPFLASAGIGQLIATAQAIKARGGFMVLLAAPSSSVMMSLEMVGIGPMIPIHDNASAAYTSALRGF